MVLFSGAGSSFTETQCSSGRGGHNVSSASQTSFHRRKMIGGHTVSCSLCLWSHCSGSEMDDTFILFNILQFRRSILNTPGLVDKSKWGKFCC